MIATRSLRVNGMVAAALGVSATLAACGSGTASDSKAPVKVMAIFDLSNTRVSSRST